MSKFLKLEIKQKNCTGLYLKVEDNFQKELKNITDINKYLKDNQTVTLQLGVTTVNGNYCTVGVI